MEKIRVKDRDFKIFISSEEILKEVDRVADSLNKDLADKEPLFLSVLNGSFMFDETNHHTLRSTVRKGGYLRGNGLPR